MKKFRAILGILVLVAAATFIRYADRVEHFATPAVASASTTIMPPPVVDSTTSASTPPFPVAKCDEWLVRAESLYQYSGDAGMKTAALATACYLSQTVDRK